MKRFKICNPKSTICNSQRGFTLIEIAIVLIIIGILLGVGASLVGPLTKRIKRSDSREVVKAAKEAVLGFAVKYKRLPTTTEFADNIKNLDAWGNTLFYYTDNNLTSGNICYVSFTGFRIDDQCPTGEGCGTGHSCCKQDGAFIILSKAENGGNDTSPSGLPPFIILEQSDTYDDIVTYGSIPELKNNVLACAGIEIETTTLPNATEDSLYTATLIGKGGSSSTWSTGQGQGSCLAGSVQLTASNEADLCLNTSTGIITGTVNVSSGNPGTLTTCTDTSTTFTVTLSQTGMESVNKSLLITVYPQPLTITTTTLPDARTGVAYSRTLSGTGGKCTGVNCNTSYTWSVVGQTIYTLGCASNSYPIANPNPNLCLYRDTGILLSTGTPPTPTAQGTYNFTVNLADDPTTPCTTTSTAFTLNVIDSCFATGINMTNATGANRSYRRNSILATCVIYNNNSNLNIQAGDTIYLYNNTTCGTVQCGTSPGSPISYSYFQGSIDTNDNCSIRWTGAGASCAFSDL